MTTTSFSNAVKNPTGQSLGKVQADGFFSPVVLGVPTGTSTPHSQGPAQFPYGILQPGTLRSTAIQTANANVVPANITGLSGAVNVGTYQLHAVLFTTVASGTAGISINDLLTTAVLGVANFQAVGYLAAGMVTQSTTTATSGAVLYNAANQPLQIVIDGTFTVTTAGTFGLQMCQSVSNASNSSVNVGSTMTLTQIA